MNRIRPFLLTLFLTCVILLTGCDSFMGSSGAEGQMRVLMTDAPADIVEANVTIERVELIGSDEGAIVLSDEEQSYNLLELQDGVTAELADVAIPEGEYSQLRIIVSDAADIELEDGSEHTLMVPSGAETGIKILFPEFDISDDDDEVEVLIDFNVEDSFVKAGESGMYVFTPVIRPETLEVNGVQTDLSDGDDD